jgi:hypothetical protein
VTTRFVPQDCRPESLWCTKGHPAKIPSMAIPRALTEQFLSPNYQVMDDAITSIASNINLVFFSSVHHEDCRNKECTMEYRLGVPKSSQRRHNELNLLILSHIPLLCSIVCTKLQYHHSPWLSPLSKLRIDSIRCDQFLQLNVARR